MSLDVIVKNSYMNFLVFVVKLQTKSKLYFFFFGRVAKGM